MRYEQFRRYEIKILSQRWGNTPFGFLKQDNPEHKAMLDCILATPQLPKQPDVWMQVTVPNEFQPQGKFNIGVQQVLKLQGTLPAPLQMMTYYHKLFYSVDPLMFTLRWKLIIPNTMKKHLQLLANKALKMLHWLMAIV